MATPITAATSSSSTPSSISPIKQKYVKKSSGIYQTGSSNDSGPIKQGSSADSTFVQKNHPTFTGGFHAGASAEIKDLESSGTKVWPKWKQGIIQDHKRNEAKAIKLAKDKGIDVKAWKYKLNNK